MKRVLRNLSCVAVACTFAVIGCDDKDGSTPKGGLPRSKQVVVYTSVDDVFARPISKRFEQETGIKILLVPDTEETKSAGLLNRLIAEQRPDEVTSKPARLRRVRPAPAEADLEPRQEQQRHHDQAPLRHGRDHHVVRTANFVAAPSREELEIRMRAIVPGDTVYASGIATGVRCFGLEAASAARTGRDHHTT